MPLLYFRSFPRTLFLFLSVCVCPFPLFRCFLLNLWNTLFFGLTNGFLWSIYDKSYTHKHTLNWTQLIHLNKCTEHYIWNYFLAAQREISSSKISTAFDGELCNHWHWIKDELRERASDRVSKWEQAEELKMSCTWTLCALYSRLVYLYYHSNLSPILPLSLR